VEGTLFTAVFFVRSCVLLSVLVPVLLHCSLPFFGFALSPFFSFWTFACSIPLLSLLWMPLFLLGLMHLFFFYFNLCLLSVSNLSFFSFFLISFPSFILELDGGYLPCNKSGEWAMGERGVSGNEGVESFPENCKFRMNVVTGQRRSQGCCSL